MRPIAPAPLVVMLSLAALASVAWPLATYTLTLGAFGLTHVLSELRYVDLRFGRRLGRTLAWGMGAALLGIVLVRLSLLAGIVGRPVALVLELGCGLALVALVLPSLLRARVGAGMLGLAVAMALAAAIVLAPAAGLLAIAVLHNLTPVGFVLEATEGARRRRAAWACVVVFAVVPLVIASGGAWAVLGPLDIAAPEATPLGYGPLQSAMRAYLPVGLLAPATALYLFQACVFMQCAHYVAVIGVLPRLLPAEARGRLRWPGAQWWPWLLAATVLALIPFAFDFAGARRGYGVLAAVHAWVEVPLLLLALLGMAGRGMAGRGMAGRGAAQSRRTSP